MLWEQAYRQQATITTAAQWVKQEKAHRTVVGMQVQGGKMVRIVRQQRGPKAGLKMPRRVNLPRYEAIQDAVNGVEGGVAMNGYSLEPAERHKELVRKLAKLHFPADETNPTAMTGVLVNVSYNDAYGRVCGYYYDESKRSTLPTLGGYLDLKQCDVCTADDIDDAYADYLREMKKGRENGTRKESEWEPWEHRQVREDKITDRLVEQVQNGHISYGKYKRGLQRLREDGYLYDDDYCEDEFGVEDHDHE